MSALFLTSDLVFASKVAGAALRQSVIVETALTPSALFGKSQEQSAQGQSLDLVIIDLSLPQLDLRELIDRLRALPNPPRTIVGFAPHVHEAALQAAQQAGCDVVMSRGQFNAQLDELLGHYVVRTA